MTCLHADDSHSSQWLSHRAPTIQQQIWLASEIALVWLDSKAPNLPWLEERFARTPVNRRDLRAITIDVSGRIVRQFSANAAHLKWYQDSDWVWDIYDRFGVTPSSISPGFMGQPAPEIQSPSSRRQLLHR